MTMESSRQGTASPPVEAPDRRRPIRSRVALCCYGIAVALLGAQGVWHLLAVDRPNPILPPAGEVLQGDAPFRFAVVGDSRGNMEVFEGICQHIQADDVSLVLHTGDIVKRCTELQYDWVLHELGEVGFRVPFCAVPGNHDIDESAPDAASVCRLYSESFGPPRYWFAYANTLFVALDNSTEKVTAQDLGWLDRTLGLWRRNYSACLVHMHCPPRDPRPESGHAMHEGAPELMRVLKRHNVTAVFASHIHAYLEDEIDGIPIYITGGAGAERDSPEVPYHYLLCTVDRGGALTVEKRDVAETANADYYEYVLRVKFPYQGVPPLAGVLVALGMFMDGWQRRKAY